MKSGSGSAQCDQEMAEMAGVSAPPAPVAVIKSSNPHLAGGEKATLKSLKKGQKLELCKVVNRQDLRGSFWHTLKQENCHH